jgi:hypothetical protein
MSTNNMLNAMFGYAQSEMFPPTLNPHGLSYGEWRVEWWKRLDGIPEVRNPAAERIVYFFVCVKINARYLRDTYCLL